MLVLTRRIGEELVIDGNIRVRILTIQGAKVRIGVRAPTTTTVDRSEIHEQRGAWVPAPDPVEDTPSLSPPATDRQAS